MKPSIRKKRLNEWVRWSLEQLEGRRVDPFLQGWRCAFAMLMAVEGIPPEVRELMCSNIAYAERKLWKKTRGMKS